MLSLFILIGRR